MAKLQVLWSAFGDSFRPTISALVLQGHHPKQKTNSHKGPGKRREAAVLCVGDRLSLFESSPSRIVNKIKNTAKNVFKNLK